MTGPNREINGWPSLAKAALLGLCPRCHARSLFPSNNILSVPFADHCPVCSFDYGASNVGDGPAALLIIPVAAIIIVLAMWLHNIVILPFWVHVIIWVPVTTMLTLMSIRIIKAALLILEYRRNAGEAGGR